MRHAVVLSVALALSASAAAAADLPENGRIGRLFEEPVVVRAPVVIEQRDVVVLIPRKVPGYYGTPTSFQQRNYYGTGHNFVYDYFPYVCEALNTCWNRAGY